MTNPSRPGQKGFWEDYAKLKDVAANYIQGVKEGRWATPGQRSTDTSAYNPIDESLHKAARVVEGVRPTFGTDWDVEGFKQALREGKPFHAASTLAAGTVGAGMDTLDPGSGHAFLAASKPILASFLGASAVHADKAALQVAQDLLTNGTAPIDVWRKTGWFQGADKKWRFEISDRNARATPVNARTVDEALQHPELKANYPQLGEVEFTTKGVPQGASGSYSPRLDKDDPALVRVKPGTEQSMRSTLLHEAGTHGVQDIEGFNRGGGTTFLRPGTPSWQIYQDRLKAIYEPISRETFMKGPGAAGDFTYEEYLKQHKTGLKNPAFRATLDRAAQDTAVREGYRRNAAEVEARNVQSRANMTDEERAASYPPSTEDVPREQQIVIMPDGTVGEPQLSTRLDPVFKADMDERRKYAGEATRTHPKDWNYQLGPTAPPMQPVKPFDINDVKVGDTFHALVGDRARVSAPLVEVQGKKMPAEVSAEGGSDYTRTPGGVWASQSNIITRLQNQATDAAKAGGGTPWAITSAMGPTAINYSHHTWEPLLWQMQNAPAGKGIRRDFDKEFRAAHPGWPGLDKTEESLNFLQNVDTTARSPFVELLQTGKYQSKGFPEPGPTRWAMTEPDLRYVKTGTSGYGVAKLDPQGKPIPDPGHPSYDTGLEGTYAGRLNTLLPYTEIWRDWAKRGDVAPLLVKPADASRALGKFRFDLPVQEVDQPLLDFMGRRLERP